MNRKKIGEQKARWAAEKLSLLKDRNHQKNLSNEIGNHVKAREYKNFKKTWQW